MTRPRQVSRIFLTFLSAFLVAAIWSCAAPKRYVHRPLIQEENDRRSVPRPASRKISLFEDAVENIFNREIDEYGNLSSHIRRLGNNHKEAKNRNALDEAPNSSWFTNRHAVQAMSREELRRGPNLGSGPDFSREVTIVAAKSEGVSPGFRVRDAMGNQYFLKFDIKGFPDLNTAAEVVTTKFVYAAGYNTPENYIAFLDPKRLRIGEGVTVRDKSGKHVPMTQSFVKQILDRIQPNADGTYRAVASKFLPGKPLGPFHFAGLRKDDDNDRIEHQHRRELRGYKVIAAWLNSYDTKANNTLDMYATEDDRSFVRHYFIDFATSLGSSGNGAASAARGKMGSFDLWHSLKKIVTLGLYVEPWEKKPRLINPSVGYFDSELFDPGNYSFIIPNPAFQRATELDGFWGAKIVMAFSDQDIRDIVTTGQYVNQDDAEYIAKTLIERRDETGRYWFAKVNPLARFEISADAGMRPVLRFADLAVAAGFEQAEQTQYRSKWLFQDRPLTGDRMVAATPEIIPDRETLRRLEQAFTPEMVDERRILTVVIETQHRRNGPWSKAVRVHIYVPPAGVGSAELVAIER